MNSNVISLPWRREPGTFDVPSPYHESHDIRVCAMGANVLLITQCGVGKGGRIGVMFEQIPDLIAALQAISERGENA